MDHALLSEEVTADVTAEKLDKLSPAQLAIAAGRDDLDFTTRSHAIMEFLNRRSSFQEACGVKRAAQCPIPLEVSHPLPNS